MRLYLITVALSNLVILYTWFGASLWLPTVEAQRIGRGRNIVQQQEQQEREEQRQQEAPLNIGDGVGSMQRITKGITPASTKVQNVHHARQPTKQNSQPKATKTGNNVAQQNTQQNKQQQVRQPYTNGTTRQRQQPLPTGPAPTPAPTKVLPPGVTMTTIQCDAEQEQHPDVDWSCTPPSPSHGPDVEGIFVCRTHPVQKSNVDGMVAADGSPSAANDENNPISSTIQIPLCIRPDQAWDTDTCGCCGRDHCPRECVECPCKFSKGKKETTGSDNDDGTDEDDIRDGVQIWVRGEDLPRCVHAKQALVMQTRQDNVKCNTKCSSDPN